jgi:hypothetical protein
VLIIKSVYRWDDQAAEVTHLFSAHLDTLALYLIYPRILKETRKSIRYLESKGMDALEDVLPSDSDSGTAFLRSWRRLQEVMKEREALEAAFQQSKQRNSGLYRTLINSVCANLTVTFFTPFRDTDLTSLLVPQ